MNRPEDFIGIDIASATFTASVLTAPGEIVMMRENIPNTPEGFTGFVSGLEAQQITPQDSVIVMEATGVYGESLCYFLHAKGFKVAVEPPNAVKKAFRSKRKNDTVDSQQIAEYGYRFFDTLRFWKPKADLLEQIRTLLTTREQLTKQRTANQNALRALKRKVVQTPLATQILEEHIERLGANLKAIDKAIKELIGQDPTLKEKGQLADKVPGVGLLLTANLMVITSGFSEHVDPKSLAAFIGICPYEHESGTSVKRKPTSDRHGTGRLRKLLYLASLSVRMHNEQFKKYFYRKVAEGKPERLVLNNIANRLLRIICATVKSGTPFIENYRSVNPALLK